VVSFNLNLVALRIEFKGWNPSNLGGDIAFILCISLDSVRDSMVAHDSGSFARLKKFIAQIAKVHCMSFA